MRTEDTRLRCSIVRFDERSPRKVNPEQPSDEREIHKRTGEWFPRANDSRERTMKNLITRFVREEEGQDLIEYSLLAALISVACIGIMTLVAGEIQAVFQLIIDAMPG
jgi:pilus assembly protein Flp/PilA